MDYAKVFFRIYPMETMDWSYVKILDDHKTIYLRCLQELAKSKQVIIPTFWTFHTDGVFYNNSQWEIYNVVTRDVLANIAQHRDAVIIAYGQTGTGKSLTINGLHSTFGDRGILPRLISDIFQHIKHTSHKNDIKTRLQMSFIEISRTQIIDLLKPYPENLTPTSLKNISKIKIKNEREALELLFRGEGRKEFAENTTYPSHCASSIFTFYLTTKNKNMQHHQYNCCKVHVLDLAGADTVGNFSCLFKEPQRIGSANLAKTQLEQFFLAICTNVPQYIRAKYKMNPMIQHVGESLNNSSVLRVIGHVRVSRENLLITISMLRFGGLIGGLQPCKYEIPIEGMEFSKEKFLRLENELKRLKMENKLNEILNNQILSKALNEDRFTHIQRTITEFLQNKISQITVYNVCDINITLEILKTIYLKCREEQGLQPEIPIAVKTKKSSSINKIRGKTSSLADSLKKKSFSEKNSSTVKSASSSLQKIVKSHKSNKSKRESVSETGKQRSKSSSSSLMKRRSSAGRRKSQSSASVYDRKESKLKSKSILSLMPEIPPEYKDAWMVFVQENGETYQHFIQDYEQNEIGAKNAYRNYLDKVEILKEVIPELEKRKQDILSARMTREFQGIEDYDLDGNIILSNCEKVCMEQLKKTEQQKIDLQEEILKYQSELKLFINQCKEVRNQVKTMFDEFCKEKYRTSVENLSDEAVLHETDMNIEDAIIAENIEINKDGTTNLRKHSEEPERQHFEHFQQFIEMEKKKKHLQQSKHKEWTFY